MSKTCAVVFPSAFEKVIDFVGQATGLVCSLESSGVANIKQKVDGKSILLKASEIGEVDLRSDTDQTQFIQVNYSNGQKILITNQLIGFKPLNREAVIGGNLPKVVATPDLVSLLEVIEECMDANPDNVSNLFELRQAFDAIIEGGEAIGFDFSTERLWLKHLSVLNSKNAVDC